MKVMLIAALSAALIPYPSLAKTQTRKCSFYALGAEPVVLDARGRTKIVIKKTYAMPGEMYGVKVERSSLPGKPERRSRRPSPGILVCM